jgi:hypothetical protein
MQWKDLEMKPKNNFTSKNDAPVALICPPINLAVAPSTVETSTYLPMPINCIMHAVHQLRKKSIENEKIKCQWVWVWLRVREP